MCLLILRVGIAASNSPVGRYNNTVTIVNDIWRKIDSLKANDPEVSGCYSITCACSATPIFNNTL